MRAAQRVLIPTKYSGDDGDCERPPMRAFSLVNVNKDNISNTTHFPLLATCNTHSLGRVVNNPTLLPIQRLSASQAAMPMRQPPHLSLKSDKKAKKNCLLLLLCDRKLAMPEFLKPALPDKSAKEAASEGRLPVSKTKARPAGGERRLVIRTRMPNTPAYWLDLMLANAAFKSYNVSFVDLGPMFFFF
jgi:hypothetical protein